MQSHLVTGLPGAPATWDAAWRGRLVQNLDILIRQLWQLGITEIYVDGSFVEEKDHPNDIDGYFECDPRYLASGQLESHLNALDPHQCWTWDWARRRPDPNSGKAQLPMWFHYHVELYPHIGQPSGITDRYGQPLQFPSAFRLSRQAFTPKGIVKIVR